MSTQAALEALYVSTDGSQWDNNDGWDITTQACAPGAPPDWAGITCEVNGNNVHALLLTDFGLQGQLPTELGLLTNVAYMDFSVNPQLQGTVPTEVGMLEVFSFEMHNAPGVCGTIPAESKID